MDVKSHSEAALRPSPPASFFPAATSLPKLLRERIATALLGRVGDRNETCRSPFPQEFASGAL